MKHGRQQHLKFRILNLEFSLHAPSANEILFLLSGFGTDAEFNSLRTHEKKEGNFSFGNDQEL